MPICGGIGQLKEVDNHILEVLKKVEAELKAKISEKRNGNAPQKLEPVGYKTQLVAGTNFFVNLKLGDGEYIHARIFRGLSGDEHQVHSVTDIKPDIVEIEYF